MFIDLKSVSSVTASITLHWLKEEHFSTISLFDFELEMPVVFMPAFCAALSKEVFHLKKDKVKNVTVAGQC